jgi:hypothetical protein
MEQTIDGYLLDLARLDASETRLKLSFERVRQLRDKTKAAHHRLRKAYYIELKRLEMSPSPEIGVIPKVGALLASVPNERLPPMLEILLELQTRKNAAEEAYTRAKEAESHARALLNDGQRETRVSLRDAKPTHGARASDEASRACGARRQ